MLNLWCYELDVDTLLGQTLRRRLLRAGYDNIESHKKYLYAEGDTPILLTAHVDTVHRSFPPEILYDKKKQILFSPDGIGGDDRAGVAAIVKILEKGYKPHVLFCDEEESGGAGAKAALTNLTPPDMKYIIALDRKGRDDAVFYQCDNKDFIQYVINFGFKKAFGTFTDISTLCPGWGIAGVNLSTGFYDEHRRYEVVRLNHWRQTVVRVCQMLNDIENVEEFEYVPKYKKKTTTVTTTRGKKNRGVAKATKYGGHQYSQWQQRQANNYHKYTAVGIHSIYVSESISARDLKENFGGDLTDWREWLERNEDELKEAIRDAMTDAGVDKLQELLLIDPPSEEFIDQQALEEFDVPDG